MVDVEERDLTAFGMSVQLRDNDCSNIDSFLKSTRLYSKNWHVVSLTCSARQGRRGGHKRYMPVLRKPARSRRP